MTTTPLAAHAANARQQLANVLAKLQQDPNVPQAIQDILSGLARAMGPLFQLERGSPDNNLFLQARGVLQQTLEKIQAADQSHPGVAEATEAVASALGTIFKALKEAGMVPAPGAGAGAQPASAQPAPAAPKPSPSQSAMPAQSAPAAQPFPLGSPKPSPSQSAMPAQSPPPAAQPFATAQPVQPAAQPFASASAGAAPKPFASAGAAGPAPQRSITNPAAPAPGGANTSGAHRAAVAASVPTGPNGMPRLESEIGVHSETNFYTDFLGDIRNNGGIFVATFHVLPIGSPCEVFLTFPGNLTAELRGVVKWKRESDSTDNASPGLGIEITQAPPEAWNLIDRFIRKREPIMHEM